MTETRAEALTDHAAAELAARDRTGGRRGWRWLALSPLLFAAILFSNPLRPGRHLQGRGRWRRHRPAGDGHAGRVRAVRARWAWPARVSTISTTQLTAVAAVEMAVPMDSHA
jgi:hypothetical protein